MFIVATCYAFIYSQWSTLFIIVQGGLISYAPFYIERKFAIHTPREIHAGISLFLFASLILGEVRDFYDTIWWWDAVLHFFAGYILTMIAIIMLRVVFTQRNITQTPFLMTLFASSFAIAASTLWEIYEFIVDQLTGSKMQPSLSDTMWDLILATTASVLASYHGWKYLKYKSRKPTALIEKVLQDGVEKNET